MTLTLTETAYSGVLLSVEFLESLRAGEEVEGGKGMISLPAASDLPGIEGSE